MSEQNGYKKNKEAKVRGALLKNDAQYLKNREGEKQLRRIEEAIKKDNDLDGSLMELKAMEWYPLEWQVEFFLKTKELLNWTDKEVFETGYNAFQYSLFLRLFLKHFINMESALKNSKKYWSKHYNIGEFCYRDLDPSKKTLKIQIKDFQVHPVLCSDIAGGLKFVLELLTRSKEIEVKETKCPFRDDDYHQFELKWN